MIRPISALPTKSYGADRADQAQPDALVDGLGEVLERSSNSSRRSSSTSSGDVEDASSPDTGRIDVGDA